MESIFNQASAMNTISDTAVFRTARRSWAHINRTAPNTIMFENCIPRFFVFNRWFFLYKKVLRAHFETQLYTSIILQQYSFYTPNYIYTHTSVETHTR